VDGTRRRLDDESALFHAEKRASASPEVVSSDDAKRPKCAKARSRGALRCDSPVSPELTSLAGAAVTLTASWDLLELVAQDLDAVG
jgi:hypothetical protein